MTSFACTDKWCLRKEFDSISLTRSLKRPAALRLDASGTVAALTIAPRSRLGAAQGSTREDFDRLVDAVVERVGKSSWDKDRLASADWERQAQLARPGVIEAPTLDEAARRINALLGKLKTSHTGLLTPDDQGYYNLLDVFSGSRGARKLAKQFRSGVHYAGTPLPSRSHATKTRNG